MFKIGDKVNFIPKTGFCLSWMEGPFEVTTATKTHIRVKTTDHTLNQYDYKIEDFELAVTEETPQELANQLRAARIRAYEISGKLRALGFTLTVARQQIYNLPEPGEITIEKTTTVVTKESL